MDAPTLSSAISSGRSRLRSGMVTDGVSVRWGGTTSSSSGMDSRNKLVGEAVADDPVNELTTDPDEERREDVSTDPDEERVSTDPDEERATDPDDKRREDAGVTSPVLRLFDEEPLRVSDGKSAGGSSATTVALPKDGA